MNSKYSEEFKSAIEKVLKEDYKPSNDNLNKSKSITRSNLVSPALNKTNWILEKKQKY